MRYLIDTNVLLRWPRPSDPRCAVAQAAVKALEQRGCELYAAPQNFFEFRCVATRPEAVNGLGMSSTEADAELARLERLFPPVPEDLAVYWEWRRLLGEVAVSGVQVHDAHLVATMRVHGITHLLTFNAADFRRYPGITVVTPQEVAGTP